MLFPPHMLSKDTSTKHCLIWKTAFASLKDQSDYPPKTVLSSAKTNPFAGRVLTHSEDCLVLTD